MVPIDNDHSGLPAKRPSGWPQLGDMPLVYRTEPEEDGVDLAEIGSMLWRRKWTIALTGALVLIVVAVATFLTPETYESSTSVLVERRNQQTGSALEVLEAVGRTSSPMETEISLVQSRRVIEPVVDRLLLQASVETDEGNLRPWEAFTSFEMKRETEPGSYRVEPVDDGYGLYDEESGEELARSSREAEGEGTDLLAFGGMAVGISENDPGVGGVIHVSSFNQAVAGAQNRIGAAPVQDANLLRIHCTASSAPGAQSLCQAVTDSYLELRVQFQRTEATAAADFLADQVEQVRQRLAAAENALGEYQESNEAVALDQRAMAEVQQFGTLDAQREQLVVERAALRDLIEEIEGSGTSGSRNLASFPSFLADRNPTMAKLFGTLVDLENRRSDLAVTRSDRNPDVIAVDARIQEVESQLETYARTYERGLAAQIASLSSAVGRSQGELSQIPSKQVASARLERQVQNLGEHYNYLQARLREAEVAEKVDLPSVKVVDQAALPLGPASPNKRMNLALGMVLGLGFGLLIALYREYTDSRIRERQDVERRTGVSVLGMIPSVKRSGPVLPVFNGAGRQLPATSRRKRLLRDRLESGDARNREIAFESFRTLLTDLSHMNGVSTNGRVRSVAITSSGRGDGKTFTACNLAIVSASLGDRTLLIDTDLRASGVSQFLSLPWTEPGFADVLEGKATRQDVLKALEVGEGRSLDVVTAGTPESRKTGVMERQIGLVDSMMRHGEEEFDLVVVDTPPLNVISDAAVITSRVDAVLVVVRAGETDRAALDMTLNRLRRLDARVMGIVLNDVELPEYYTSYSFGVWEEDLSEAGKS